VFQSEQRVAFHPVIVSGRDQVPQSAVLVRGVPIAPQSYLVFLDMPCRFSTSSPRTIAHRADGRLASRNTRVDST